MSQLPPDPRSKLEERIENLKKRTLALNAQAIFAQAELERAKQAVQEQKRKAR